MNNPPTEKKPLPKLDTVFCLDEFKVLESKISTSWYYSVKHTILEDANYSINILELNTEKNTIRLMGGWFSLATRYFRAQNLERENNICGVTILLDPDHVEIWINDPDEFITDMSRFRRISQEPNTTYAREVNDAWVYKHIFRTLAAGTKFK